MDSSSSSLLAKRHSSLLENEQLYIFQRRITRKIYEIEQRQNNTSFISPSSLIKELNKCTSSCNSTSVTNILQQSDDSMRNTVVIVNKLVTYAALQPVFRKQYIHIFKNWYSKSAHKHNILNALNLYLYTLHFKSKNDFAEESEYMQFCSGQKNKSLVVGSYVFICMLYSEGIYECQNIIQKFIEKDILEKKNIYFVEILCAILPILPFKFIEPYFTKINTLNVHLKEMKKNRLRLLLLNALDDVQKGYKKLRFSNI